MSHQNIRGMKVAMSFLSLIIFWVRNSKSIILEAWHSSSTPVNFFKKKSHDHENVLFEELNDNKAV